MICAVIYCSFCCIYVWLDPGTYMIARFMSFYKPGVTALHLPCTITLNVECRGTSVERMVVMMERTAWMRGRRRGLLGKLHGTFLWFPDCSGCLQTRRRRSCCVGMSRAVIKTEWYVTLQIVLNGDILITPMAGSVMILGISALLWAQMEWIHMETWVHHIARGLFYCQSWISPHGFAINASM